MQEGKEGGKGEGGRGEMDLGGERKSYHQEFSFSSLFFFFFFLPLPPLPLILFFFLLYFLLSVTYCSSIFPFFPGSFYFFYLVFFPFFSRVILAALIYVLHILS